MEDYTDIETGEKLTKRDLKHLGIIVMVMVIGILVLNIWIWCSTKTWVVEDMWYESYEVKTEKQMVLESSWYKPVDITIDHTEQEVFDYSTENGVEVQYESVVDHTEKRVTEQLNTETGYIELVIGEENVIGKVYQPLDFQKPLYSTKYYYYVEKDVPVEIVHCETMKPVENDNYEECGITGYGFVRLRCKGEERVIQVSNDGLEGIETGDKVVMGYVYREFWCRTDNDELNRGWIEKKSFFFPTIY